eukprot:765312-Prymnesium_polylepis.1
MAVCTEPMRVPSDLAETSRADMPQYVAVGLDAVPGGGPFRVTTSDYPPFLPESHSGVNGAR